MTLTLISLLRLAAAATGVALAMPLLYSAEKDSPPEPQTKSLVEAIARSNLKEIERHVAADPSALNDPMRGPLTALQFAVMRKNSEATQLLLRLGADPLVKTESGQTLLHLAVERGSAPIADALLEFPIDLAAHDKMGWTVWHQAAAKNDLELINLFAERGHRPTTLSKLGGTPLHEAAVRADAKVVLRLLELGVDPYVVSEDGRTALEIAVEYENQPASEALRNR